MFEGSIPAIDRGWRFVLSFECTDPWISEELSRLDGPEVEGIWEMRDSAGSGVWSGVASGVGHAPGVGAAPLIVF